MLICVRLCERMDCSPPVSVHGTLQARRLEWVAIFYSRGYSQPTFLASLALTGRFFTTAPLGKPHFHMTWSCTQTISKNAAAAAAKLIKTFSCCQIYVFIFFYSIFGVFHSIMVSLVSFLMIVICVWIFSLGTGFWVDSSFLLSTWNTLCCIFPVYLVSDEKSIGI